MASSTPASEQPAARRSAGRRSASLPASRRPVSMRQASQAADLLDLGAALVTSGLVAIVATDRGGLPRVLLALGFTFFVPGRAIVTNWPRMARWSQAAVAIVLSLAVVTLAAMVTLWLHAWDPVRLFYAEAGLCLAALGTGVSRRRWSMRAGPASPGVRPVRHRRAEPHG